LLAGKSGSLISFAILLTILLFTTLKMEGISVSHFRITAGTCFEGGFFSGVRAEGIGDDVEALEKEKTLWPDV
jgi:hypothetical protein